MTWFSKLHINRVSVAVKVFLPVLVIIFAIIFVQTWLNLYNQRLHSESVEKEHLLTLNQDYTNQISVMKQYALALAVTFAARPDVQDLLLSQDRQGLLNLLLPVFTDLKSSYNIVQLYIHQPNGTVFLRLHDPSLYGDSSISRQALADALSLHKPVAGVELDPSRLGVSGLAPVVKDGLFIGVVEVGLDYDQSMLESLKSRNNSDYKMWITYAAAAPTGLWPREDEPLSPSKKLFYYAGTSPVGLPIAESEYLRVLQDGNPNMLDATTSGGEQDSVLLSPLKGYGDRLIGVLEITVSRGAELASLRRAQVQAILAASALALIVLLMLLALDNYAILRPLRRLTAVAHRQLQGNLTVRAENLPPDEFGVLGTTFNSLTEQLSASIQGLERQVEVSRKAENALAEERNVLRTLIDHVPDSIYVIDTEGRKTLTNPADLHYIGVNSESEVLNKTDFDVYDPEMAAQFWADNRTVIESQKPLLNREELVVDRQGNQYWLLTSKLPLRDSTGKVTGLVGIGRDITERKQAEDEIHRLNVELEQRVRQRTEQLVLANHELEAFAYSVSHDLRAPLRAMNGFSQVLAEDYGSILDETAHDYIKRIQAASLRMSQLIEDLLQLSRVTRSEIRITQVDLAELAREIAATLQVTQPERNVTWVTAPSMVVKADAAMLRIALNNLLGNAWKFTSKTLLPRIEFGAKNENGSMFYYVNDNGAGFDMAYAGKLFGAFQRLHTDRDFEGTGIGLALVQRIIHRHGGKVWGEGIVGKGATFYFTLGQE